MGFIRKNSGFTFTELLTALAINGIIFTAIVSIFLANLVHYKKTLSTNRLNQQLGSALDLMKSDIRRAGYWANAMNDVGTGTNNNPFQVSGTTDITVNASNNCILLSYDKDSSGTLPAISGAVDDERYGFRLSNGAIQARPPGATFSCNASNWDNVTDTALINITALTFTLNTTTLTTGPGTKGVLLRSVDISVTGQLANDATVTRTLTQHVRIQNAKFTP